MKKKANISYRFLLCCTITLTVVSAFLLFCLTMAHFSEIRGQKQDQPSKNTASVEDSQLSESETTDIEEQSETPVPHREDMEGISDKGISDIDISFWSSVRNDQTGNWRMSWTADPFVVEEYALSYYNNYFENDKEIHAIINFTYSTTTRISVMGDRLDVTTLEYIDGEEHDARLLFGGMLLTEYFVYLDNGDIERIQ